MAVSGKSPTFEIPYFLGSDSPPDMGDVTKAQADRLEELLAEIKTSQLEDQTAGKLLLANASGVVTGQAMSGDVTISSSGVTTIGAEKVGTTRLANSGVTNGKIANEAVNLAKLAASLGLTEGYFADGAVTSRKFKPTVGERAASEDLPLTGSYQDIAMTGGDLEVTPTVASFLKVTAIFDFAPESGGVGPLVGTIRLDSEDQAPVARFTPSATSERATVAQVYRLSLTVAKHTIKMRAKRESGTGSVRSPNTRFLYELVAA